MGILKSVSILAVITCLAIHSLVAAGKAQGQEPAHVIATGQENQIAGEVVPDEDQKASKTRKTSRSRQTPSTLDHFMRIRRDKKRKPVAFESSITRYIGSHDDQTVQVDLIGVVHIGEQDYYEQLNQLFKQYDSVLYELVAPEGTVIPQGGARDPAESLNPIAALQMGMQAVLGLEFQLEHIDYGADNFRHADMSPEEFLESMKNNDESFTKMFFKAMGQSMAQSSRGTTSNLDLLRVAFAKDKEIQMRKLFAKQMMEMEGGLAMFEGRDGSTIINHRNSKALEVMQDEIESGKRKIAIFYGAGHLPDFERRLSSDFKMRRGGQFWLEAWKLKR